MTAQDEFPGNGFQGDIDYLNSDYNAGEPAEIRFLKALMAAGGGAGMAQLAASTPVLAKGAYATLKGLGNAGEMALGGTPEALAGAKAVQSGLEAPQSGITVFIKGIQKGVNGEQIPIYGVKGPANELKALFGDEAPGSIPESILRTKGLIPEQVPESQNRLAPFAQDLRELWGNLALEQSGTPLKIRAPYMRPDAINK
jgi:hypothetical protein